LENTPKNHWNVYGLPLKAIKEGEREAVYECNSSAKPGTSYRAIALTKLKSHVLRYIEEAVQTFP
jgi:hypothetical protein